MLEGTDAKVHFIHYTPQMEEARSRGELGTNSFVRLRKLRVDRAPVVDVNDLGDAEMLLNNPRHFEDAVRQLIKRGIMLTDDGWGGWLGHYQGALCRAAREIDERQNRDHARVQERTGVVQAGDDRPVAYRATGKLAKHLSVQVKRGACALRSASICV